MKKTPKLSLYARLSAVALLASFACVASAQTFTNIVISKFDGTEPFQNLYYWWGVNTFTSAQDPTVNNPTTLSTNEPGSGSLKCSADWTGTSGNGGGAPQPQLMVWNALAGQQWNSSVSVNGYYYDLNFDIMVDPNSAKTANGDFGHIRAGVTIGSSWGQVYLWDMPAYTNTGWTHVHAYIDPSVTGVDDITGFFVNWPWQTGAGGAGAIQGVQTFWIDNVIFSTNLTKPLNPPTISIKPAPPAVTGLNLSSSGSAQYDRNNIATVNNESWVNVSGPVTYSLTIASHPGTNNPSFQTHIMLASSPGTESAPDWNEPNVIMLDIKDQADGVAVAQFRYKTNQPGGNSMLYGAGALGSVSSTNGVLGTWSMTFVDNTNIILTAPTGATNMVTLPDDQAVQSLFVDPIIAYFGEQPNNTADIGQKVVLSNVKITGTGNPINDNFSGPALDTSTWVLRASQPANVFIPSSDAAFVLSWTLPDSNFGLEVAPSLTGPWTNPGLTNTSIQGSIKSVTVPKSALPAGKAAFFRFMKPVATKLQVLLPGETAAPGTPTGKTGTPTAQTAGVNFTVTVNAVDDKFNIIKYVNDTVAITSSDATAALPANAALVGGTQNFTVSFGATGNPTVTATDLSDSKKQAGTSAPVAVQ